MTSVTVNGRLVATFNEVGLAATVAGLGLVSMAVGAARKEISESTRARVLADWHMGEVELHAVFSARKAVKPSEAIRFSRARVPRCTGLSSSSKKELRSKQAKRSERNFSWRCAGWFGSFLEEWPGRIRTLNGASDVKLRFEMKLIQASESCSRSHNDLARFDRANPRKDASDT